MNEVIRRSAFETNSSSTHSIVIDRMPFNSSILRANADGVIELECGEFGWEQETYNNAYTKASYCLTYLMGMTDRSEENYKPKQTHRFELKDVNKSFPATKGVREKLIILFHVIQSETFRTLICEPTLSDYYPWGYIDHQSFEVCEEAFTSEETLRAFIFSPLSILVTDNDNH